MAFLINFTLITSLDAFNELLLDYIRKHNLTVHSSTQEAPLTRYEKTKAHVRLAPSRDWLNQKAVYLSSDYIALF